MFDHTLIGSNGQLHNLLLPPSVFSPLHQQDPALPMPPHPTPPEEVERKWGDRRQTADNEARGTLGSRTIAGTQHYELQTRDFKESIELNQNIFI